MDFGDYRIAFVLVLGAASTMAGAAEPTGTEVVKQCYYKHQGQDQKTTLAIEIRNPDGKVNASQYLRLWKDYTGEDGDFEEKMVLYTTAPKEQKGINYMRWSYRSTANKPPEQWVYLPELQTVRRVSQRDPTDMTWGLTDEDFRVRLLDEDDHVLVSSEEQDGRRVYMVESRPRSDSVYSRWLTRFATSGGWDDCTREEVKYYDKADKLLKKVTYRWRRIGDVWVWDDVTIDNNNTLTVVTYRTMEAAVNVGLGDKDFTERELRRGAR